MGAFNSRLVETSTTGGENVRTKYAVSSVKGRQAKIEDAYAIVPDLDRTTSFFGLYDGHAGSEVALLCARLFHLELRVHPNYQANLNNAMRSVFSRMDEVLQQSNEWRELVTPAGRSNWIERLINAVIIDPWRCKWGTARMGQNHVQENKKLEAKRFLRLSIHLGFYPTTQFEGTPYMPPQNIGSSVTVVVARGSRVTVGNVGDTHCVASRNRQAIQLSTDHKPSHRNEIRRIQRAGGKLYLDKFVAVEVGRMPGYRAFRGLCATSRSIGDFVFKQNKNLPPEEQMVICNPDIRSMEITDDVDFLVIASYGIWASMTRQAVVDFVHEELGSGETDLSVICARLVQHVQPTRPDATAILIQFKRGSPEDDAEGSQDDSDGQEIKSDASDDQEIKSEASGEEQPFAPDRQEISRALEFVRSKQREHMLQDVIRNTVQSPF